MKLFDLLEAYENIWQTRFPVVIVLAFGVIGLFFGLIGGYQEHGIGGAIVFGAVAAAAGAIVGALVIALFANVLPLVLLAVVVVGPIVGIIWLLIVTWNVK